MVSPSDVFDFGYAVSAIPVSSGATLRRFELRGEPRKYDPTPGSSLEERQCGGSGTGRARATGGDEIDKKGRGIERNWGSSWCLFFTPREAYARRIRAPHRSPISDSINMALLNNERLDTPWTFLESLIRDYCRSPEIRDEWKRVPFVWSEQKRETRISVFIYVN